MKKTKKFDLIDLESKLDTAYHLWVADDNEESRSCLFVSIRKLAFAILSVNRSARSRDDIGELAYDYALYLFERIILKVFIPVYRDKMPWQSYVDLNLKHIVFSKDKDSWMELVSDFEYLVNNNESIYGEYNSETGKEWVGDLSKELRRCVRMFFTDQRIRDLLPVSVEFLFGGAPLTSSSAMPSDIRDFISVLVSIAKRLTSERVITKTVRGVDFEELVSSATKSSLFFSSVVNSDFFPKELFLALDMDSLHRLILLLGGEKVKIPTQKELNTVVGAAVAISKVASGSIDLKKALNKSKRDYGLVFSHQVNIQNFVSRVIDSSSIVEGGGNDPAISILLDMVESVEKMFDGFVGRVCSNYEDNVDSFNFLINKLDSHIESVSRIKCFLSKVISSREVRDE